ncbi:hypothetical protein ARMSODRAFT_441791 [Armillaria solidipes]|uniref:BTB domain-containing protein n=1 Tax=Armillaria solidipes TaxID=1076256 RepID=A0A2H3BE77_9AGAR|nr:hypothetical protein ARMSODRAFT_441791 [Armillaria solidipes]
MASVHVDATRITGTNTRQPVHRHMPAQCVVTSSILPSSFLASMTVSQDLAASHHPSFNTPGAHAILSLLEGTSYCLSSFVLRRTTAFFVPNSFTFKPDSKSIPIHVHDVVLGRLLGIINGLAIPPWRRFDDLEGVLTLAKAWGAGGAIHLIRASITVPASLRELLRTYVIATRFRCEEETGLASKHPTALISPRGAASGDAVADLDVLGGEVVQVSAEPTRRISGVIVNMWSSHRIW